MFSKELLKKIKRLEIRTARLVEGAAPGGYLSGFKGRGIEFTEVREYAPGDDVRAIDWNVTARMGAPYVKTFMEERDLTVMLVLDVSGSMDFGTAGATKRELAVEFCAAAALLAVQMNDRVGLLAYSGRVESFIPPRKGVRHVTGLLTGLAGLKSSGRGTNASAAAGFIMKTMKSRATLFWLSDFIGTGNDRSMKAAARRHELIPVLVRDALEDGIPPAGLMELADPEGGGRLVVDTSSPAFASRLKAAVGQRDTARSALFRSIKAEPLELLTGVPPIKPLAGYFRRRARIRRR